MPAPIVGIDLGTTNSLVAVCDAAGPRVLSIEDGSPLLPSVVRYVPAPGPPGFTTIVGSAARARSAEFPHQTISSIKRLMGRSLGDAAGDLPYLSYKVISGERGTARVAVPLGESEELSISPEEVSAQVLMRLRDAASQALGQPVTRAVITVPAYFDDAQRQATRTAARLAGLEAVRVVAEPTAAALAYGLGLPGAAQRAPMTVAVYDLGGGTFDISVLRLTPATRPGEMFFFQVLGTGGDTHLGGDDADHALVNVFQREIAALLGTEVTELPVGVRRQFLSLAEAVKIKLSDAAEARVDVDLGAGRRYERTISREEFEGLIEPLVQRTLTIASRVVERAAQQGAGPLDAVIMVGGATRIPLVRQRVGKLLGLEPYIALDPDRVVALGAAVQAAVLDGVTKGTLLLDVIPLSLGVETVGGAVAKLITANSAIPARATEMFSTSVDGQTSIRLTVYQGEREMAADCRRLGEFHLRGLPPMPAGIPQLEVQFLVDANGILNVSAHERRSGKRAALQVVPNHGLTQEEVERIERESLTHAREDMDRHRVVDLIANSRLDLKWIGERYERYAGQLEASYRESLGAKIAALRSLLARAEAQWTSVEPGEFQRAKEDLDRSSIRLQEVSIAQSLRDADEKPGAS